MDRVWKAGPGDTLFFKKGATIVEQHFEEDVCLLMVFIPDSLTRSTVREVADGLSLRATSDAVIESALPVESDVTLAAFFQSMRTYLCGIEKPSEPLVRLKLKELIISVLSSGRNSELAAYFRKLGGSGSTSVAEIMEQNFRFNLSLEEYAKLCHRSRSSFKREFQTHFQESPGKWLLQKRLDYSAALLGSSEMNITEVAFESGFDRLNFPGAEQKPMHQPDAGIRSGNPQGDGSRPKSTHEPDLPLGLTNLNVLALEHNQLTNLTLPPDPTNLTSLVLGGNPLTSLVLSEPEATNLFNLVASLRGGGIPLFTYPLTIQLVRSLPLIGAFKFGIIGPPGIYTVLGSTDLVNWSQVGVASNMLGAVNFTDVLANPFPRRFYRVQAL